MFELCANAAYAFTGKAGSEGGTFRREDSTCRGPGWAGKAPRAASRAMWLEQDPGGHSGRQGWKGRQGPGHADPSRSASVSLPGAEAFEGLSAQD